MIHGGRFNVGLMDGHAKGVGFRAGKSSVYPTENVGLPSNMAEAQVWCSDPERMIDTPGGKKACKNVPAYLACTMTETFPQ